LLRHRFSDRQRLNIVEPAVVALQRAHAALDLHQHRHVGDHAALIAERNRAFHEVTAGVLQGSRVRQFSQVSARRTRVLVPWREAKVTAHLVDDAVAIQLRELAAAADPDHGQVLFQIDFHVM